MADIFEIAKEYGEADYYEMSTGRTYHIQEWARAKRLGLPTEGIKVSENGMLIGIIRERKN